MSQTECVFCTTASRDSLGGSDAHYVQAIYAMAWSAGITSHSLPPVCVRHAQEQYDSIDLLARAHNMDAEDVQVLRLVLGYVERPEGDPSAIYERAFDFAEEAFDGLPERPTSLYQMAPSPRRTPRRRGGRRAR